jgi:hypothetical protein
MSNYLKIFSHFLAKLIFVILFGGLITEKFLFLRRKTTTPSSKYSYMNSNSFRILISIACTVCFVLLLIRDGNIIPQKKEKPTTETTDSIASRYPFSVYKAGSSFRIVAEIESEKLINQYLHFFEQNGYSGNGACWEGHIIQILEKNKPDLLRHLRFDSEAGAFVAETGSKRYVEIFLDILCPVFNDMARLEQVVQSADHSKILD